eukprot:129864-Amphidinium_carterae.2
MAGKYLQFPMCPMRTSACCDRPFGRMQAKLLKQTIVQDHFTGRVFLSGELFAWSVFRIVGPRCDQIGPVRQTSMKRTYRG